MGFWPGFPGAVIPASWLIVGGELVLDELDPDAVDGADSVEVDADEEDPPHPARASPRDAIRAMAETMWLRRVFRVVVLMGSSLAASTDQSSFDRSSPGPPSCLSSCLSSCSPAEGRVGSGWGGAGVRPRSAGRWPRALTLFDTPLVDYR